MTLNDYQQQLLVDVDEFINRNRIPESQIAKHVQYEKLQDVTCINLEDGLWYYFDHGKLQLIYASNEVLARTLWDEFQTRVGSISPEKIVGSRAGKTSNQLVFASHGFAASITKDEVHFIEMFPPCTVEYYLNHIYQEPRPFIR